MSGAESGGACAPLTFRAAREIVRGLGLTIRRTGYGKEVRVADPTLPPAQREAEAHYTDDLEDAIGTAAFMARKVIR